MTAPHAPLSGRERLAWRAAGWLLTAACGALTVSGFWHAWSPAPAARPAVAMGSATPATSSMTAAREATPAPAPARRHRCTRPAAG